MKKLIFILALSLSQYAFSEILLENAGSYLGFTTWVSQGKTDWNSTNGHPDYGDPTSELFYRSARSNIIEMNGRLVFSDDFFFSGNLAEGKILTGKQTDNDYFSQEFADELEGPTRFSSTFSDIDGDRLFYFTLDFGKKIHQFSKNGFDVSLFTGFQYWREKYDAYGGEVLEDPYGEYEGFLYPRYLLELSDEVEWRSLRLGTDISYQLTPKFRIFGSAVYIPYSDMYNEDSQHLRQEMEDLGPVPNGLFYGHGYGFQGELNVGYTVWKNFDAIIGGRYWILKSDGDFRDAPVSFDPGKIPFNDLDTERYGLTLSLRYTF